MPQSAYLMLDDRAEHFPREQKQANPQIALAFVFTPQEGSELNGLLCWAQGLQSLCARRYPKAAWTWSSQVTLGGPAWAECLDQVTSNGPSNLSLSVDATLSHCPSLLRGQGENGHSERKWGWPGFIGTHFFRKGCKRGVLVRNSILLFYHFCCSFSGTLAFRKKKKKNGLLSKYSQQYSSELG